MICNINKESEAFYLLRVERQNITELSAEDYRNGYSLLSDERRAACDRYLRNDDKKRMIAADILLKKMLGEALGKTSRETVFYKDEKGKPYTRYGLFVSISHSGIYAAAAVSDQPVGVDIEEMRPVPLNTCNLFCDENEKSFLFSGLNKNSEQTPVVDPVFWRRYFSLWTFKEAYFKCYGFPEDFRRINYFEHEKESQVVDDHYMLCVVNNKT